jgi:hypothetical protein
LCVVFSACIVTASRAQESTFEEDIDFLKKYDKPIVLSAENNRAKIAVSAKHQGRVFTSTFMGDAGISNGWINYEAIKNNKSGVGGEDRFWLAPIGSQFSLFYPKEKTIEEKNWRLPPAITRGGAKVIKQNKVSVEFEKSYVVESHIGTKFSAKLNRTVTLFTDKQIQQSLNLLLPSSVNRVGFESANKLTNVGEDWDEKTGLITPWILGMFKGHDDAVAVFPLAKKAGSKSNIPSYLYPLNDNRIIEKNAVVYFKVDGRYRSKIGVKAEQTKPIMGYFNSKTTVLTIVTFSFEDGKLYPDAQESFVNHPYKGDVISSYNHGAMDGSVLSTSTFFELESSAQVLPLKTNEAITHRHQTYHFSGPYSEVNDVSLKLLGTSLKEITSVFSMH